MSDNFSLDQINMMKHAWGWSSKEPGFRTHYCTHAKDQNMEVLVIAGMFECTHTEGFGKDHAMFHLTDKGIEYLKELRK